MKQNFLHLNCIFLSLKRIQKNFALLKLTLICNIYIFYTYIYIYMHLGKPR